MLKKSVGIGALVVALASCSTDAGNLATDILPKRTSEYGARIGDETVRLQRFEDKIDLLVYRDFSDNVYNAYQRTLFEADSNGNLKCVDHLYTTLPRTANSRFEEPWTNGHKTCDSERLEENQEQQRFVGYLRQLRDYKVKQNKSPS